jgi:hypothetical protein
MIKPGKSNVKTLITIAKVILIICVWPILIAYLAIKFSKRIKNTKIRYATISLSCVIALIFSIVWFGAMFNPQSSQTANVSPKLDNSKVANNGKTQSNDQTKSIASDKTATTNATTDEASNLAIGSRTKTSGCIVSGALQDKACTPGAIFAGVTKAQVCVSGYSASVRDVSESTKNAVYAEYGITSHTTGQYEVDHLVSLELGGSNDIANLWPEAANPTPGFHQKDVIENELHNEVCNGTISLTTAQDEIASDWLAIYQGTTPTTSSTPQAAITPAAPQTTTSSSGEIKLSTTGICHVPGDAYYDRTTNYTSYPTLQACEDAGGRPSEK